MTRVSASVLGGLLALVASAAQAEGPRDLPSLFANRADVWVDGEGPARLTLPAEVLVACRPDLSDLRLIDEHGREIPYAVDSGLPPEEVRELTRSVEPRTLDVSRSTTQRENAPPVLSETFVLEPPPTSPDAAWSLAVRTPAQHFVRTVSIVARLADGSESPSITTTIFRLREESREKLELALPDVEATAWVVTLHGEADSYLEPAFVFVTRRTLPASEQASLELDRAAVQPPRELGRSRIHFDRPRGIVPDVLRLETSTRAFSRRVEVWDIGPGASTEPLADAVVARAPAGGEAATAEVKLRPAFGDRLAVLIHDGDSRPLGDLTVHAVLRRPALVFSVPAVATGSPAATLYYGGGRAHLPDYDVSALLPAATERATAEAARIAGRLFDPESLSAARLGDTELNPGFDETPALAFAMRPGVAINPRSFSHRASLDVPSSSEGLLRVRITPNLAAVARPDLGDLRIVDGSDRQWSYLLERDVEYVELRVEAGAPERRDNRTVYRLALPTPSLRVAQLIVDSRDGFFSRPFQVVGELAEGGGGETVLASGLLARRLGDPREIQIDLGTGPVESLELRVDDGSDPPLDRLRTAVRVPVSVLYFAAPAGRYGLLAGEPDASPPRYELETVRDVVLAVQPLDVSVGRLAANPAFTLASRLSKGSGLQQILLWGTLALAVLVLTWLTLRLARQDPG